VGDAGRVSKPSPDRPGVAGSGAVEADGDDDVDDDATSPASRVGGIEGEPGVTRGMGASNQIRPHC